MLRRILRLAWVASLVCGPAPAAAQAHRVGPTLRFGTGLLDVPVASVLPHGTLTLTFSGFRSALDRAPLVDASGEVVGSRGPARSWYGDASLTVGLWDRLEGGVSLQDTGGEGGASIIGGFGRLALLRPENGGIGLAVGARYLSASGSSGRRPGRLGIPDPHLVEQPSGRDAFDTELTPYVVATGTFQGPRSNLFPAYDVTLSVGVGGGLFAEGSDLPFYAAGNGDGWFAGSALHLGLGSGRALTFLGEYNGFEVNAGAVVDLHGFRVGAVVLGANHGEGISVYRSRKLGLLASVAFCPFSGGVRCGPERNALLERPRTEAIILPAPPPDTVLVVRPPAQGRALSLCLSTGREVRALVTAAGDTLVGPGSVSLRDAGGDLVFAGEYAEGREWYDPEQALEVRGGVWEASAEPVPVSCSAVREWASVDGVPLFVDVDGVGAPARFYLPVRPGVWRAYVRVPGGAGEEGRASAPRTPLGRQASSRVGVFGVVTVADNVGTPSVRP